MSSNAFEVTRMHTYLVLLVRMIPPRRMQARKHGTSRLTRVGDTTGLEADGCCEFPKAASAAQGPRWTDVSMYCGPEAPINPPAPEPNCAMRKVN